MQLGTRHFCMQNCKGRNWIIVLKLFMKYNLKLLWRVHPSKHELGWQSHHCWPFLTLQTSTDNSQQSGSAHQHTQLATQQISWPKFDCWALLSFSSRHWTGVCDNFTLTRVAAISWGSPVDSQSYDVVMLLLPPHLLPPASLLIITQPGLSWRISILWSFISTWRNVSLIFFVCLCSKQNCDIT